MRKQAETSSTACPRSQSSQVAEPGCQPSPHAYPPRHPASGIHRAAQEYKRKSRPSPLVFLPPASSRARGALCACERKHIQPLSTSPSAPCKRPPLAHSPSVGYRPLLVWPALWRMGQEERAVWNQTAANESEEFQSPVLLYTGMNTGSRLRVSTTP